MGAPLESNTGPDADKGQEKAGEDDERMVVNELEANVEDGCEAPEKCWLGMPAE